MVRSKTTHFAAAREDAVALVAQEMINESPPPHQQNDVNWTSGYTSSCETLSLTWFPVTTRKPWITRR